LRVLIILFFRINKVLFISAILLSKYRFFNRFLFTRKPCTQTQFSF